ACLFLRQNRLPPVMPHGRDFPSLQPPAIPPRQATRCQEHGRRTQWRSTAEAHGTANSAARTLRLPESCLHQQLLIHVTWLAPGSAAYLSPVFCAEYLTGTYATSQRVN